MDIKSLHEKLISKEVTLVNVVNEIFDKIEKNELNSFITLNKENAINKAKELDKKLANGHVPSGLFGVPVALKDNILTKGIRTTAASKSLEEFIPIYDAKVVERIYEADAILIGKANMDEYAMGSSSETSYFGVSVNPYDRTVTPGGSSSGSATSVAGEEAIVALGTDTGGSVRNPADFCHIVGFAPTYGAIPREGVISMSNSFDRVGVLANNVNDVREMFNVVRGKCDSDFTTIDIEDFNGKVDFTNLKIARVELKEEYNVDSQIKELYEKTLTKLEKLGAQISNVEIKNLENLDQAYTVIMAIEVESNIAKIDGLRYGTSVEEYNSTEDFYRKNRTANFGEEVKRRIALGNFFASKDTDQRYYKQAMKIRGYVRSQVEEILSNHDVLITPTTLTLPKKVGETIADSYAAFDDGMYNAITNLCDVPSISIPMHKEKLGSIQITGSRYQDMKLLKIAELIEGGLK